MTNLPLAGIRIIEMQGIGPGPFCGMHFADLGADVIVVERPGAADPVSKMTAGILKRGKRSIVLDMKNADDVETVKKLIATADGLIEGNRPGVMERLGLGPDVLCALNPKLVYGRLTGWGQTGPLAQYAGHDLNYAAITGSLYYTGAAGEKPLATPTIHADVGGGSHYLMIGMLAALLKAAGTGKGDVIDCAMVDGAAHSMNLLYDLMPSGMMSAETRGESFLDGPHWFNAYACADGGFITVGSLEPKFYGIFIGLMELSDDVDFKDQFDKKRWPAQSEKLAAIFKTKTRDEWTELLQHTDACFGPVLNPSEAAEYPHNKARGIFDQSQGHLQAVAAPRFQSVGQPTVGDVPEAGAHTDEILKELNAEE